MYLLTAVQVFRHPVHVGILTIFRYCT